MPTRTHTHTHPPVLQCSFAQAWVRNCHKCISQEVSQVEPRMKQSSAKISQLYADLGQCHSKSTYLTHIAGHDCSSRSEWHRREPTLKMMQTYQTRNLNFRSEKAILGALRVFSRHSRNSGSDSWNARAWYSRLEQCENYNSRSDCRNWWKPHMTNVLWPCKPRALFSEFGWSMSARSEQTDRYSELFQKHMFIQGVLQGVAFRGVQFLREKRLISLHEKRARRTVKMK